MQGTVQFIQQEFDMTEHFTAPSQSPTFPAAAVEKKRRRWPWILAIISALLAGVGVGAVGKSDPLGDRTAEVAQREIDATAREEALTDREQALDSRKAQLDQRNAALDQQSGDLARREQALLPKEQEAAKNIIKGDGVYLVGIDINPGTYRNSGGSSCYWKRASGTSGDFGEILANGNESGPAVVTIEASDVAFTSKRCGSWTLVS